MKKLLASSFSLFNNLCKNSLRIKAEKFHTSWNKMREIEPHLGSGSQRPSKVDGKLRLYSMEYCPYAQRVRLVLHAKNIPHDVVNINLMDKPDWYFKIHPGGVVPAIDTGSEIIIESLVISDFLDNKFPENSLYPKDPEAKRRDQELIKKVDPLAHLFLRSLVNKAQRSLEEWIEKVVPLIDEFELELSARGTTYFRGGTPGMVDYMLWPWMERIEVVSLAYENQVPRLDDQFPVLRKWRKSMQEDPPCTKTYNEPAIHWEVAKKKVEQLRNAANASAHL